MASKKRSQTEQQRMFVERLNMRLIGYHDPFMRDVYFPDREPSGFNFNDPEEVLADENRAVHVYLTKKETVDQLPRKDVVRYRATLEKMGFTILEPTEGDDLFHDVKLPTGWTKKRDPQDARTTFLCDTDGNARYLVWIKGASYDRDAYGYPLHRYEIVDRTFDNYTGIQFFLCDRRNHDRSMRVIFTPGRVPLAGVRAIDEARTIEVPKIVTWAKEQGLDIYDACANWDEANHPTACELPDWRTNR